MSERMGLVIFLDRCPSAAAAERQGAAGWTKCMRCLHGVAIGQNEFAKIAAGTLDPVCLVCGEELYLAGDMKQAKFVGNINAFGQIIPEEEP